MKRSIGWAPTIALSWLWGLGFFYSFHVTLTYGWCGFVVFAAPNAFGLFAFGWILGDPTRNPSAVFRSLHGRYAGLFLASQVLAVAITIFAAVFYLFIPLFGIASLAIVAIFILLATAVGHSTTIDGLKRLHAGYLGLGVAAASSLLVGLLLKVPAHATPLAAFDDRFYGLMMPSLVGFLLGPWTDVQHWQRVIAIREGGGSVRKAYSAGAILFLALITLNATIAAAAGPALVVMSSDGLPGMQAAVAGAIAKLGGGWLSLAYAVWAGVAIASTLDSFYFATRWLLRATCGESKSPLMAFVPMGMITSPIWFLLTAIVIAFACVVANVAMIFLMIAYATLFVGAATCLVCEVISGQTRYDGVLCGLIGVASIIVFSAGYLGDIPAMTAIAPLVGLIGALPALQGVLRPKTPARVAEPQPSVTMTTQPPIVADHAFVGTLNDRAHGFEGSWFVMHMTPTYDDTNSVGNVYFANYLRWVGKARELMFNTCLPDFDLQTTDLYILTKSFEHEFRRELIEFQAASVRLKIFSYNRKFATVVHEIHSRAGLVGRGEQTLMFVDRTTYRPLDIPASVLQASFHTTPPNEWRRFIYMTQCLQS